MWKDELLGGVDWHGPSSEVTSLKLEMLIHTPEPAAMEYGLILHCLLILAYRLRCVRSDHSDDSDDGVRVASEEPDPQAEPYIFHPQETEILEAAAKGAARLVSAGLSEGMSDKQQPPDLLAKMLALLGFDSSKLSAIAINAIIFIAQLISTTLIENPLESEPPSENPGSWIFENSPVEARELVKEATQQSLPDKVIEVVRDSSPISTDCVELLICKGAPLLWGMQRSLSTGPASNWGRMSPIQRMYSSFPQIEQVADQAKVCDTKYPACKIKYATDWD